MNNCNIHSGYWSLTTTSTRKQKHHLEGNAILAGYSHTNAHYAVSIVTIRSIWHNASDFFLHLGKFQPQICKFCGAIYRHKYKMFSAL